MRFETPTLFSSDDDSFLSMEDEEDYHPTSKLLAGAKNKHLPDPSYDPTDDELDSQEEIKPLKPKLAPQKRKLEGKALESGITGQGIKMSPSNKKPKPGPPKVTVTKPVEKGNSAITNSHPQDFLEFSSDESSPSPTTQRMMKKAAAHEDRNYVASNSDDEDRENEEIDRAYIVPENEKSHVTFDFDRERNRRLAIAANFPKNIYTKKEKDLFLQLAMRGFEPLAPKHWQFDFPTLPNSLFPEPGKEKADPIIKTSRSTTFYAIKSLSNLFSLSGRVRDCSIVEKRPESLIKQTIQRYIRWAFYDVNLEIGPGSLPVHVIHAQRKNESVLHALERLNKRLRRLAFRHQRALAESLAFSSTDMCSEEHSTSTKLHKTELPLLVGFIICGPVVAIMTFDLGLLKGGEHIDGKFISQFDLSERGQDVWNSLSITIVVMHIRNTMARLSQKGYGGFVKASRHGAVNEDL
ncbi:uncharacterized protein BJX67DRAFT_201454 [Aspergillus lucknowensis]|uniref:Uncharacterized protein n=1 Tax=Aspergillus lucknowensis TaxID=176173 RepID=A0ABR4LKP9_9EURO